MQVNGFQFHGKVYIAFNKVSYYYRIYEEKDVTTKEWNKKNKKNAITASFTTGFHYLPYH